MDPPTVPGEDADRMQPPRSTSEKPATPEGTSPLGGGRPLRQLAWFFGGLVIVYVAGLAAFWPAAGAQPSSALFAVVMVAPTVGAVLARFCGGARIQWGRPSLWILAGLIPAVVVLGVYLAGVPFGLVRLDANALAAAMLWAPLSVLTASVSALGEEVGWRGFLWPMLRQRFGFWTASLIVGAIWWLYHVPLVLLGWYGTLSALPAFTLAIAGFVVFVGVLTDRSRSLWPSVLAHAAWNALVATSFAVAIDSSAVPAFTANAFALGEFGWPAAATMALLGGAFALWHVRRSAVPVRPRLG
jgi:membrane protease YdiL (CAAX protease family)